MSDLALVFASDAWRADLAIADGGVLTDDGLVSAIVISLFTDRRARTDDVLPQLGADRRGWWGDCGNSDANDLIGSRLWLLEREKLTEATALKARDIFLEALGWLTEDGIVRELTVETRIFPPSNTRPSGALGIAISFTRPDGPGRQRHDFVWDATARSLS